MYEWNIKLLRSWIVDGRNETEIDLCGFKFSARVRKAKMERMRNTIKQVVFDKLSMPSLISYAEH